jgi:hypothetical protein
MSFARTNKVMHLIVEILSDSLLHFDLLTVIINYSAFLSYSILY